MEVRTGAKFGQKMRSHLIYLLVVFFITHLFVVGANDNFNIYNDDKPNTEILLTFSLSDTLKGLVVNDENWTRKISGKCSDQVNLLLDGLKNGSMWAMKMVDASSKIPSGLLSGNVVHDFGMYDECIGIGTNVEGKEIHGRHCMYDADVKIGNNILTALLSICLPAVCDSDDIQILLNQMIEMMERLIGINGIININEVICPSIQKEEWTPGAIATIVAFSVLLGYLTVCTICDLVLIHTKVSCQSSILHFFRQFSFYTNGVRLLGTKTTSKTVPALQGLRFYSICWIILGHEYVTVQKLPVVNSEDLYKWVSTWIALCVRLAPFAVDTFFTISGFLLAYLFLKEMSTGRSFNIFQYYFHRYIRLTPPYASLILLAIFIIPRMGSGPLWEFKMGYMAKNCREQSWVMLLYLQNYIGTEKICFPHSWYLAVEMQLFFISPLILYPLARKPKIGLTILGLFLVSSIAIPAILSYQNEYTSVIFSLTDRSDKTLSEFYNETHIRAHVWLIGIACGYLIFTKNEPTRSVTKWIGWILAVGAFAFCTSTMRIFQSHNYEYNIVWETVYSAVARPIWAYGVAWIIYASVLGFGGPVAKFLSFPFYNPLSRISYCLYLVHRITELTRIAAVRVPIYFNNYLIFNNFLSTLVFSTLLAVILSLVVEAPVLTLEKIFKNRNTRPKKMEEKNMVTEEKVENGLDNPNMIT